MKKAIILLILLSLSVVSVQGAIFVPAEQHNNITDMDHSTAFPGNTTAGIFTEVIDFPSSKYEDGITKYISMDISTTGTDMVSIAFYNWNTESYEFGGDYDFDLSTTDGVISSALTEDNYPIRLKVVSTQSGNPAYHAWVYDARMSASSYNYTAPYDSISTENDTANPPSDAFDRDDGTNDLADTSYVDISTGYCDTYDPEQQQYLDIELNLSTLEETAGRINITGVSPEDYYTYFDTGLYPLRISYYNYQTAEYDYITYINEGISAPQYTYTHYVELDDLDEDYLNNGVMNIRLYAYLDTCGFYSWVPEELYFDEVYLSVEDFEPNPPYSISNISQDYEVILQSTDPSITFSEGYDFEGNDVTTYVYIGTSLSNMQLDGTTTGESYTFGNNITLNAGSTYYYELRTYNGISFSDNSEVYSFHINAKPTVTGVTLSPALPAISDDLTVSHNSPTDPESDPTTTYYKWYKDSVLQSSLSNVTTVLADNTSNGEIWQVGVIISDGYQNSSEVLSQAVEIGSTNTAPSFTSITPSLSIVKKNVIVTFAASGATDPDGDYYYLEVGNSSGERDLVVSGLSKDSNINVSFAMPFDDGLDHDLYVRLNDTHLASSEYIVTLRSDTTPPVYSSSSVSSTTGYAGDSVIIYVDCYSTNSTISSVELSIDRPDTVTQVLSMAQYDADTWYYNYGYTSDVGTYSINYFNITDLSDKTVTAEPTLSFVLSTAVSGGGGSSGGDTIYTNATLGDLTLSPAILDTYALYTDYEGEQTFEYEFLANREIDECSLSDDRATCEILEGYIVKVYYPQSAGNISSYEGTLTVSDPQGYVATSSLVIRVTDVWGTVNIIGLPNSPWSAFFYAVLLVFCGIVLFVWYE